MAIFTNKIVSAAFHDKEKTTVEIVYEENDQMVSYILEVDFTQDAFNDLLKEVTLDEIEEATIKQNKAQSKFFNDIINKEIDSRWAAEKENLKTKAENKKLTGKKVIDALLSQDEDNDFVFNMKISILEDPIVANSKDKELKMSIRKAKTALELLRIYTTHKA